MSKIYLITGKRSDLSKRLIDLLLEKKYKLIVTVDSDENNQEESQSGVRYVYWNRKSSISSKTLLLESLKEYGNLDGAIIFYDSQPLNQTFYDVPTAIIENTIDSSLKGVIFLVKELVNYFNKVRKGTLSFIIDSEETRKKTIIDNTCLAGFRGFADNFVKPDSADPFSTYGFLSQSDNAFDFASFILNHIEENETKDKGLWHRFGDKSRIISGFPGIKRK